MSATTAPTTRSTHYLAPSTGERRFGRAVIRITRLGLSMRGSRELILPGRRTGEPRSTAVNLLELDGRSYLVSPRGETEWVRNLRANEARGELRLGRKVRAFDAQELADADKVPVLRAYLERWAMEVGRFFDGVGADSTDEELAAIAGRHPVFALEISRR